MKHKKICKTIIGFLMQLAAWGSLIGIAPLIIYFAGSQSEDAFMLFNLLVIIIVPVMIVYFVNYYLLVPLLFLKERKIWFVLSNILLLLCVNGHFYISIFTTSSDIPHYMVGIVAGTAISFVLDIGALGIAIAVRNYLRTMAMKQKLAEETHRRTEAELLWLKNQLNPHFLFNSLNNISSLICIDAEQAQDCIGELSDLLRYAIYESEKKKVQLYKEIDFMSNYIALMSLRCNDKTEISTSFEVEDKNIEIAPLLLISLIENAFKHGVSASLPSFLSFKIDEKDGVITFISENSDHHKPERDQSGSGIGIMNLKKRLELIYPDLYTWQQEADGNIFRVKLTIDLNL